MKIPFLNFTTDVYDWFIDRLFKKKVSEPVKKLKKALNYRPKYDLKKGITENGRKYWRFRFKMRRYKLDTPGKVDEAFYKINMKYNSIRPYKRKICKAGNRVQRILIVFSTKDPSFDRKLNRKTERYNKHEIEECISTEYYDIDERSTEKMFKDLNKKVKNFREENNQYPRYIAANTIKTLRYFDVIFIDDVIA
jgi:hypothetical protein